MRTLALVLTFLFVATTFLACPKKEEKPGEDKAGTEKKEGKTEGAADKDKKPAADEAEPEAKPAEKKEAAAGPLELAKYNLKVKAPAGSAVKDAPVGEGYMIQGPNIVVTITPASDMTPATLKDAKEDIDMYTPLNIKEEELPNGWILTFENKGGMGTNYWVKSRLEFGGKAYSCDTTASTPEQQKNALDACKSLAQ